MLACKHGDPLAICTECLNDEIAVKNEKIGEDHDRIAKLEAELAEALRGEKTAHVLCDTANNLTAVAQRLLDAEKRAHARTQAELTTAQAEAMAMHRALSWKCTCDNARTCRRCLAMDGKTGRTLAERVTRYEIALRQIASRPARVETLCGDGQHDSHCPTTVALAALDEKGGA